MIYEAKLDIKFWAEAISHANWLRNRLPAQRVNLQYPIHSYGPVSDQTSVSLYNSVNLDMLFSTDPQPL